MVPVTSTTQRQVRPVLKCLNSMALQQQQQQHQQHRQHQQHICNTEPIDISDAFVAADCDTTDEVNTRSE